MADAHTQERDWLIVGFVQKPHGVHGDLLVEIITDFPERLTDATRFGLGPDSGPREFHEVHRIRYHQGSWLLSVSGLRDRDAADSWRGKYLFLPEQTLDELPEGYYYEHHLVGLEARFEDGGVAGEVVAFEPGPGQSRLVVRRPDRREYLVPFVPQLVRHVDLEGGYLVVEAIPGLLDDRSETVQGGGAATKGPSQRHGDDPPQDGDW